MAKVKLKINGNTPELFLIDIFGKSMNRN